MSPATVEKSGWKNWDIFDWNRRFFHYFFCAEEGDTAPVSRIVVNRDVLMRVAETSEVSGAELEKAFRNAVRERLQLTGQSLCTDALQTEWDYTQKETIPRYFAHLVVTCFAASGTGGSSTRTNDFRDHLNRFLGRDGGGYFLRDLPQLWEMLRAWVDHAIAEGKPYRRLILRPQPANLRLIGYSLSLAFPTHRDQRLLQQVVGSLDLPDDPPVLPILRAIAGASERFSDTFQSSIRMFERRFLEGDADLFEDAVWSAILEAVGSSSEGTQPGTGGTHGRIRSALRLERGVDWRFMLRLFLDGIPASKLPSGLRIEQVSDLAWGDYEYVLRGEIQSDKAAKTDAGSWILSGDAGESLPITERQIRRTLDEGVLLFVREDDGHWTLMHSMPMADEVRGLVREDLASGFVDSMRLSGADPRRRSSQYEGWSEVDGFSGRDLRRAKFANCENVLVLQATIAAPKLWLSDGVPVDGGWLGLKAALPEISVAYPEARVSIRRWDASSEDSAIAAEVISDKPESYRIGEMSVPKGGLDGQYVLRAHVNNTIKTTRVITFRSSCLRTDFRRLRKPREWITEGGKSDVAKVTSDGRTPSEVSVRCAGGEELTYVEGPDDMGRVASGTHDCAWDLVEVLGGLASRKTLITMKEGLKWCSRVLGLEGRVVWEVLRAWEEAGIIDCPIYRKWRGRAIVARRPRIVVSRMKEGGAVLGTVQGLVPKALRRQLKQASEQFGIGITVVEQISPWIPSPLLLAAPSMRELEALSEYSGLEPVERLLPIEECLADVSDVSQTYAHLRRNHVLSGYWYPEHGGFGEERPEGEVVLERYRKDDVPDAFVVRSGENAAFHSLSKTWALLCYYKLLTRRTFCEIGGTRLVQEVNGVYLPLVVGRWNAAAAGVCSGPTETLAGKRDYAYAFGSRDTLNYVVGLFWRSALPQGLSSQKRQLERLLRSVGENGEMVAIPGRIQSVLRKNAEVLESHEISRLRVVDRRVLPSLSRFAGALREHIR